MKDGRTHLAHKAEHAVDLETGAIVGVTVQGADQGDTTTIAETVTAAAEELEAGGGRDGRTDGGDRRGGGRQGVSQQSGAGGSGGARSADVHRRAESRAAQLEEEDGWPGMRCMPIAGAIRGARGLAWQRRRSEHLERPNAHLYETGGLRRPHVRGHANILKRLLIQTSAFNVGLLMRTLIGVGTPRGLQGRLALGLGTRRRLVDTRCRPLASRSHTIRRSRARRHTASSFRTISSPRGRMGPFHHGLLGEMDQDRDASGRMNLTPLVRIPQEGDEDFKVGSQTGLGSRRLRNHLAARRRQKRGGQAGARHALPADAGLGATRAAWRSGGGDPGERSVSGVWTPPSTTERPMCALNPDGELFAVAMIESAEAVGNITEILEAPVSAIMVVPGDMAIDLGLGPNPADRNHTEIDAAFQTVLEACQAQDRVICGCGDARSRLQQRLDEGWRFVLPLGG